VKLRKVVLDANLYIDWLNAGRRDELMVAPGLVRYLSVIVQMELRVGATTTSASRAVEQLVRAYRASARVVAPAPEVFDLAGCVLQRLRAEGREIRRASLLNDVLIALSARSIGATLITADQDYEIIRGVVDFKLQRVS
jgi:predicted nucleic acid-binding protein